MPPSPSGGKENDNDNIVITLNNIVITLNNIVITLNNIVIT